MRSKLSQIIFAGIVDHQVNYSVITQTRLCFGKIFSGLVRQWESMIRLMLSATRASSRGRGPQTPSASDHVNYLSVDAGVQILPRLYCRMLDSKEDTEEPDLRADQSAVSRK